MVTGPAQEIIQKVHTLDASGLDTALQRLGLNGWSDLSLHLTFWPCSTGGGCMMLSAELPGTDGCQLVVTDGEAGLPASPDHGWVGIVDPNDEELYSALVDGGRLVAGP